MSPNASVFALFVTFLILLALPASSTQPTKPKTIDYANAKQVDSWLRHPVYGDPSFDSFKRLPGNPIHRGEGEFGWPVNGFLFIDPVSKNWYIYVGEYMTGYVPRSRCVLLRSTNQGKNWQNLGPVVKGDPKMFDKDGHTPDATVVYDNKRYHMVYDWGELNFNAEGGLAYAWADKPEGPWHRAPEPLTRVSTFQKMLGRYYRTYGPMLFRRKNDWLLLTLVDNAPNSWAVGAMTAKNPEGPYSACTLIRNVESTAFHPPLMESFPAFSHDGYIYASATSVALNRDFQVLWRAPVEQATDPKAWKTVRYGSYWHTEDLENEFEGLWGQTPSGQVLPDGRFMVMFNSRDPQNRGTVNLAERPWNQPLREKGFVMSGHGGPSFTLIDRSYKAFNLNVKLKVRGTARIIFDYQGPIGPNQPTSDATLHPQMMTSCSYIELSDMGMKVITVDSSGRAATQVETGTPKSSVNLSVKRTPDGKLRIIQGDTTVLECQVDGLEGPLGLWVAPRTHLEVEKFEVEGDWQPAHFNYLYTEGLLGAGEKGESWETTSDPLFRFGIGAVHKGPEGIVKWNFIGTGFKLWSPKGPSWGRVQVVLDGKEIGEVDLKSDVAKTSAILLEKSGLKKGPHCLVLKAINGLMAVDSLEVIASR